MIVFSLLWVGICYWRIIVQPKKPFTFNDVVYWLLGFASVLIFNCMLWKCWWAVYLTQGVIAAYMLIILKTSGEKLSMKDIWGFVSFTVCGTLTIVMQLLSFHHKDTEETNG